MADISDIDSFLAGLHPYDSIPDDFRRSIAGTLRALDLDAGDQVYEHGQALDGLFLVATGEIEIRDPSGGLVSVLGPRNSFGERGLMRDGRAVTSARAMAPSRLLLLPRDEFEILLGKFPAFQRFFDRGRPANGVKETIITLPVSRMMNRVTVSCAPETSLQDAAKMMRDAHISSLAVVVGSKLEGIVTTRDLTNKAVAEGLDTGLPVSAIMTRNPVTLGPDALCADVLSIMLERRIGHMPIVSRGELVGMITQTDLTRHQAVSSSVLIREIVSAESAEALAQVTARIPQLLVQLASSGNRHDIVTRLITDIADSVTRRLIALAEARLGPPPVPYVWLACGSQGRQEQTGVSDQDNCMILDDQAAPEDSAYFEALAEEVCAGLDQCGYYLCPGEMMATNPRWRQPLKVWRGYFKQWIDRPVPEAQMLASVMFDLRPIHGAAAYHEQLVEETLRKASTNSIFVAHMVANSLKHTPPLSLFRAFATIRSGEHKDHLDLKHNGVVPVTDLARVYAIQGRITQVNTRQRLEAAAELGVISASGAKDLIDAYDLIAATRISHQCELVQRAAKPDNFMAPATLSDFERSHLRDAFVVVRTMQSALGHSRSVVA